MNNKIPNEETALHLAAKSGNTEILREIIRLGGDLSLQMDKDGHTPLHDCLQQVYYEGGCEEKDKCQKFIRVWNAIVEEAVTWWCLKQRHPKPVKGSEDYDRIQRTAVYFLRARIYNEDGLSVLQYGANMGLVPCVHAMLVTEDVLVVTHRMLNVDSDADDRSQSKTNSLHIDITNLSQEYFFSDLRAEGDITKEWILEENDNTTFVESLLQTKTGEKVGEILEPIVTISCLQWRLILHLVLMVCVTFESLEGVKPLKRSETTSLIFVLYISISWALHVLVNTCSYACISLKYWVYGEKIEVKIEDIKKKALSCVKTVVCFLEESFVLLNCFGFFSSCISVEGFLES